jgi:hypothetical protein
MRDLGMPLKASRSVRAPGPHKIGFEAWVAQRQHAVWREHIEQLGNDLGRMVKQSVGGMVPLAPIADEPGLEKGEHIGVLAQHGAELIEMSEHAIEGSVGRILGAGIV